MRDFVEAQKKRAENAISREKYDFALAARLSPAFANLNGTAFVPMF